MTPFESYFAAHIEPHLKGAPPAAVKMAKASAGDIWNAALDAASCRTVCSVKPNRTPVNYIPQEELELLRARVTP